jgi:hypothetical protein
MKLLFGEGDVYRKMGYYNDQQGILRRYLREKEFWDIHLDKTKKFILKKAQIRDKGKAAVLGSGWLLDVPAEELSAMFDEVWLFDIRHPLQIRHRLAKFQNIRFIGTDISGFARPVYLSLKNNRKFEDILPEFDFDLSSFDYVVSCNILNQLDILLIDYIKKKMNLDGNTETMLRKKIQQFHLQLLPEFRSVLISDAEELLLDKSSQIFDRRPLVFADDLPEPSETWMWHFDNHCMYNELYNTCFQVHAFEL